MGLNELSNPEVLTRKTYFKTIVAVTYLNEKEGAVTVGKLRKFLDHSESAMTYQLSELESFGIIERSRDPNDKRRSLIAVNPEGLTRAYVEQYLVNRAEELFNELELWNSLYLTGLQAEVDHIFNLNTLSVRQSYYANEYFLQFMQLYISTYAHLTFEKAHAERNERVDISIRELFDHISEYMGALWIPRSAEELHAPDEFKAIIQAWDSLNSKTADKAFTTFKEIMRIGSILNVRMPDVSIAGLVIDSFIQQNQR